MGHDLIYLIKKHWGNDHPLVNMLDKKETVIDTYLLNRNRVISLYGKRLRHLKLNGAREELIKDLEAIVRNVTSSQNTIDVRITSLAKQHLIFTDKEYTVLLGYIKNT